MSELTYDTVGSPTQKPYGGLDLGCTKFVEKSMVAFQSNDAAFPALEDGFFIPVDVLGGVTSDELADGVAIATRASKIYYSMLKGLTKFLQTHPDVLGFAVAPDEALDPDRYGTKEKIYPVTVTRVSDDRSGMLKFPEPATIGIYAGSADFALTDIFADAVTVAKDANTPGAGVLLLLSELANESYLFLDTSTSLTGVAARGAKHPYAMKEIGTFDLSQDSRELVRAMLSMLYSHRVLRSDVVASGLTASSYGSQTVGAIPTSWYAATNPRATVNSDHLRYLALHRVTFSNTIEIIENEDAQTFDVNAVVTPAA